MCSLVYSVVSVFEQTTLEHIDLNIPCHNCINLTVVTAVTVVTKMTRVTVVTIVTAVAYR